MRPSERERGYDQGSKQRGSEEGGIGLTCQWYNHHYHQLDVEREIHNIAQVLGDMWLSQPREGIFSLICFFA